MNTTLIFVRLFFVLLCALFLTLYVTTGWTTPNYSQVTFGIISGLAFGVLIVGAEMLLSKKFTLRHFNVLLVGLFLGYLMAEVLLAVGGAIGEVSTLPSDSLFRTAVYLPCLYIGMVLTARAADQFQFSIPFVQLKGECSKKKDVLIDWSILGDSRILDIAASGLLDNQLIVPRFMLAELYAMLESPDEAMRARARRCLDVFKKLETTPLLNLRYSEVDVGDVKDPALKLVQLAHLTQTNIITADVARLQQYAIEGIRIINIHMLSNVLKPMATGEHIAVKIQRYGKEPRQGVGYLDDGTMVVINGGAEFLGETIKAQVLSVKHTSSGRMIFCNANEEGSMSDPAMQQANGIDLSKNFYSL